MSNMDESISTLRFASTAKKIKNKARINEDSKETLLRKFQQQIEELRRQLETAEQEDGEGGKESDITIHCDITLYYMYTFLVMYSDTLTTFLSLKNHLPMLLSCPYQVRKVLKETN